MEESNGMGSLAAALAKKAIWDYVSELEKEKEDLPDPAATYLKSESDTDEIDGTLCLDLLKTHWQWKGKSVEEGLAKLDVAAGMIILKPKIKIFERLFGDGRGVPLYLNELLKPGVMVQFLSSGLSDSHWAGFFHRETKVIDQSSIIKSILLSTDAEDADDIEVPSDEQRISQMFDTWLPFVKSEDEGFMLVFYLKEEDVYYRIPTIALFKISAFKLIR